MVLPVPVVLHGFEAFESLASRVAIANGYPSLRLFYSTNGFKLRDLYAGDSAQLAKLAHLSRADTALLAERTVARATRGDGVWMLGDASFNKESRRAKRLRFCPCCVVSDIDTGSGHPAARPFVRASWISRAVKNCTAHERPLVEVAFKHKREDDFCRFVQANLDSIRTMAADRVTPVSVDVDRYAEDRIRGVAASAPFLNRFEAHVAIELCFYLGQFIKRDRKATNQLPVKLRDQSAREIGFEIARQGEDAIRAMMASIIRCKKSSPTFKPSFGALGRWLRDNVARPSYSDVVELFQDVAERNFPLGTKDTFLVKVRRRYVHTVTSASIEYGLFENRVVDLLKGAGLIQTIDLPPSRIWFDADSAHEILANATKTMTSAEARGRLGVTENAMSGILKAGLLPRVETRTDTRIYSRIRSQDFEEFQIRLFESVSNLDGSRSLMTVQQVCRRCGGQIHEILALILNKSLKNVAALENHGFQIGALRLDAAEAVALINGARLDKINNLGLSLTTVAEAQRRLRVHPTTVPYLIQMGFLKTTEVRNPRTNYRQNYIVATSVEDFARDHVSIADLASTHETHPMKMFEHLTDLGIKPIFEQVGRVARFFRKADVTDVAIGIR